MLWILPGKESSCLRSKAENYSMKTTLSKKHHTSMLLMLTLGVKMIERGDATFAGQT